MKIVDANGNVVKSPDYTKGYLVEDSLLIAHQEAVQGVEEKGHYETIREYPNGGKDVEWIVDTPGVEPAEARDEYESVMRYIPYTEKELLQRRIEELKGKLRNTDYNIFKIVEGASTLAECAEVIKQRAGWRKEINELERMKDGNQDGTSIDGG